ncbi:hypothetical protein [Actinomycetospora chiangmaiensis]|uniref:hypothetical protein n=1 Tax=Actinomycetospora chiangmaiensis TaxID=402650 RepID=UPI0003A3E99F|nr:hypothetical protein [Actinomycetospora chiangmaiensis]
MVESGLRFAFAFLPAGVAVVVGLVLAVQRRKVQPDVATPAFWGLALQLVAIIAGALVNVIPSSIVQGGGSPQTAVTVATVIALVVAALTVVSWVLILTALFRRLPSEAAVAGSDAPTRAVPTPPPGFAPEPFADDAPTGRHALLDEHGQQVVAQAGVRLSPQTAGLAAGAAGGAAAVGFGAAAAGSGPFAVPEHTADLPTEAVPVVRTPDADEAPTPGERDAGTVEADQPDPGPAGVDEAAVGGTPTGADPDDAEAPVSPADVAPPAVPAQSVAAQPVPARPDPGPAGVDEAAVGGTPTGADASDAPDEGDTALTPTPDAARTAHGVAEAAAVDVDEAAVGGTPTTADADPGTPPADHGTSQTGPASAPQPAVHPSAQPSSAPSSPQPSSAPSSPQPSSAPSSPQPSSAAPSSAGSPSGPPPAARPTPRPAPSPVDAEEPADPSSGAPASHPGLAGTMRTPRPAPAPARGSDLFTPSAPIPEVPEEAVGGTPVEPQEASATRSRSSKAPVAGWFEPVTDGSGDSYGAEHREN